MQDMQSQIKNNKCVSISISGYRTFALHSWSEHTDSAGVDGRLHVEPSGEVWHILATVADGECVRARVERDVGDGVGSVSVVLDVDLSLGAAVRDDLDGQLGRAGVGTVHDELPFLPDLGALQAWARAAYLRGGKGRRLMTNDYSNKSYLILYNIGAIFSKSVTVAHLGRI